MTCQRFEDMDGCAFVGHVGQKGASAAVTAGAFNTGLLVKTVEELTERV